MRKIGVDHNNLAVSLFLAYDAMLLVAGRTQGPFSFLSAFPPFMLTVACSLPCSLVPLNCIKTLAI